MIKVGEYGYQNFLNVEMHHGRLFENHPKWFGMDKNGERTANPHTVFCTSNQEAVDYLHSNLLSYLKAHPETDVFDFCPPDSETWCRCPECEALGNSTERHALLVNRTARFLQEEYPHVKLECLAYSRYTELPKQELLAENILLDFCPINQNFECQIYDGNSTNNKGYSKNLLAWNPEVKVDSLTKEYCTQLYGPVANIAVSVYNELENIVRFGCKIPHTKPKSSDEYREYILRLEGCSNKVEAAIK